MTIYEVCSKEREDFLFFSGNIYLFVNIRFIPFKVKSLRGRLCQRSFSSSKHLQQALVGMVFSSFSDEHFISLIVAKLRPLMSIFSFGGTKSSQGL